MTSDIYAEIRDLAARRDIADAVNRYMRGLDRLDGQLQRSAFHEDAFIDVGFASGAPDEFVKFCQDLLGQMDGTHHMIGQVQIELNGDTASGECYFQAWHGTRGDDGNPRNMFVAGRYVDEYVCRDGDWRITRRALVNDWVSDNAANHGYYSDNPETIRGSRRGKDFSQTRDWAK